MDYLTTHYKNLSEQLQKQAIHLTQMLNEAHPPRLPKKGLVLKPETQTPVVPRVFRDLDNWSYRMRKYIDMNPSEFLHTGLWGEPGDFQLYARYHYGIILQHGGTFQRLTPDGIVQHWTHSGWITIDKPGVKTFFGPIGADGRRIPGTLPPGGHNPLDIIDSPAKPFGTGMFQGLGGPPLSPLPGSGTGNINPLANPGT
jgi:hypothetical protein